MAGLLFYRISFSRMVEIHAALQVAKKIHAALQVASSSHQAVLLFQDSSSTKVSALTWFYSSRIMKVVVVWSRFDSLLFLACLQEGVTYKILSSFSTNTTMTLSSFIPSIILPWITWSWNGRRFISCFGDRSYGKRMRLIPFSDAFTDITQEERYIECMCVYPSEIGTIVHFNNRFYRLLAVRQIKTTQAGGL